MRLLKWIAGLVLLLVVLVVGLVLSVPLWFDPNDHRDRIVDAVEANTGRSFELAGEIGLSLFPRLAVTMGEIRLGNDPAFPGDGFLKAGSVAASVDVMPLLSGEVRVGEVLLEGVQVDLMVDESGRGNWESLVERMAGTGPAPTEAPATESSFDVALDALALVDGRVSYRDLGADLNATLDDLSLRIEPVAAGAVTDVTLSADYSALDYAGRLDAALEAEHLLDARGPRLRLVRLDVTSSAGLPLAVALDDAAVVDLEAGTVSLPGLRIRSDEAEVRVSAEGTGLPDTPSFSGRLEVPAFDVGAWLSAQAFFDGETTDPAALDRLSFETGFTYADGVLALADMQGRLDDSTLTGDVTVGETIRFELSVDDMNVDRYLPPTSEPTPEPAPAEPTEFAFGRLDGSVQLGRLIVAGLEATDIEVRIRADERGLRIEPATGALYGGALSATVAMAADGGRSPVDVQLEVNGVQAGELLGAWMETPVMTGAGDLRAELSLADAFALEPLRGLGGDIAFDFSDGALYGINVVGALRQALVLVGRADPSTASSSQETDFSSFRFRGSIARGILDTTEFALASPYLRVSGEGTVNLAEATLAYRLEPVLLRSPAGELDDLGQLEGTRIPVALSGPLAAPAIELDAAGALLSSQLGRLESELAERLGLDDADADEDAGKQLLRGLLEQALDDDDDDGKKDGDGDAPEPGK